MDNERDESKTTRASDLVDWKNPPTLVALKRDLDEAKSAHELQCNKVTKWLQALRADKPIKSMEGRSKVQPKLVRKQSEWRYSALEEPFLSTDKMFEVNPATFQDVEPARQNAMVLNKQFRVDIPKVALINRYVRNAVNQGTAILKLSWETQVGQVLEEVPVYTKTPEETMMVLQQMVQMGQIDEQTAQMQLQSGQPIQIGTQPQMVEKEVVNRPVIEVRDVRDLIIDPSCRGDFNKARFVIDQIITDLSTLKEDGRYSNLDKIEDAEFVDKLYFDPDRNEDDFRFSDKPRKKMVMYEYWGYWDIDGEGIVKPIVVSWIGNNIVRMEENPYPDKKIPFVVVQYLPPDTDTVYGDADASLLEDNQDIIGAVTRSMIDIIGRSANAQQGVRKDLLDPINRDRFNKGLDFEFNPVNNLGEAIYMTKMPELPKSSIDVLNLQNAEAEALTGIKAFTGGISGDALGSNVGGIRSALDATAKRELGILRRLSQGLKEVGRKIMAMNAVWLSDEEIIRVTDEEFVAIKRSNLAGNFDLELTVSTAEVDNQKASELAFMLQTMGNSVPFDITKLVLFKIAELRKLPDLAQAIKEYEPQPDPMQQKAAELQLALLEAQVFNEQAKGAENQADVDLKRAKTQTEMAKAGKTTSEKDNLDLDYIKKATTNEHQQDMEKQAAADQTKLIQSILQAETARQNTQATNQASLMQAAMQNETARQTASDNNKTSLIQSLLQNETAKQTAREKNQTSLTQSAMQAQTAKETAKEKAKQKPKSSTSKAKKKK